jgi:hypothetical protein
MKGRLWFSSLATLMALLGAIPVLADDHGHRHSREGAVVITDVQGALPVREVTVRDVQVRPVVVRPVAPRPSVSPRPEVPRPVLPDVISRPHQSAYPQATSRQPSAGYTRGRRSYYLFSPRFNIGTSLLVGYPVAYPYPYAYPFIYDPNPYPAYPAPTASMASAPPTTYSNLPSGGVTPAVAINTPLDCGVDPNASTPCGGVSFDVFPGDAQVSVEGVFVGTVDGFSPTRPPLVLSPGQHYIEIRMPGYRTEVFETTVNAGEVIPYQGTLEPLRTR